MNTMTAILIDDESSSRNALRQKLNAHCPEISIITECENGEEGILAIEKYHPDVVFLDVEMPRMNGFTMLGNLHHRDFDLIFTTAYDHYAIQAIRFSAIDYLVKPIDVNDLTDAVVRVHQRKQQGNSNPRIETLLHNLLDENTQHVRIAIPSQEGIQFVRMNDILYLEAASNYTTIYMYPDSKILVSKTLKHFEDMLPVSTFIRIHNSFLINKNFVQKYIRGEGGQVIMSNGKTLDVSRRKKEEFLRIINS